jgi:hypothetical protein
MLSRIAEAKLAVEDDYKRSISSPKNENVRERIADAKAEAKQTSEALEQARNDFLDDLSDYLMDALNDDIYRFCEANCGLFTSDAREEQSLGCHDIFLQYQQKLEAVVATFLETRGIVDVTQFVKMVKQAEALKSEKVDAIISMVLGAADYDTFAVMMATARKCRDEGGNAWTWL